MSAVYKQDAESVAKECFRDNNLKMCYDMLTVVKRSPDSRVIENYCTVEWVH